MERNELSPKQKPPPRKGRRAPTVPGSLEEHTDTASLSPSSPRGVHAEPVVPPRSRKTGGWAEETLKSGKSRRSSSNLIEQERLLGSHDYKTVDSDDDIPLIPDIEEVGDDLLDIAEAPEVSGTKVTSFSDLASDVRKKPAFSTLDDLNLSALAKFLYNESDLKEMDVQWSWDLLFTEVSSELRSERELLNKETQTHKP